LESMDSICSTIDNVYAVSSKFKPAKWHLRSKVDKLCYYSEWHVKSLIKYVTMQLIYANWNYEFMYFLSVLVLISMSCPAVVRRGAHVCVICVCRGVISFLFFSFFLYL
jgi:hypothetical protein